MCTVCVQLNLVHIWSRVVCSSAQPAAWSVHAKVVFLFKESKWKVNLRKLRVLFLKFVHFKKTVVRSSFLSKLLSFSVESKQRQLMLYWKLQWFGKKMNLQEKSSLPRCLDFCMYLSFSFLGSLGLPQSGEFTTLVCLLLGRPIFPFVFCRFPSQSEKLPFANSWQNKGRLGKRQTFWQCQNDFDASILF